MDLFRVHLGGYSPEIISFLSPFGKALISLSRGVFGLLKFLCHHSCLLTVLKNFLFNFNRRTLGLLTAASAVPCIQDRQ